MIINAAISRAIASTIVDARGLAVAPGFINMLFALMRRTYSELNANNVLTLDFQMRLGANG